MERFLIAYRGAPGGTSEANDFNDAVRLAGECPIFDEHGWVEIARLTGAPAL